MRVHEVDNLDDPRIWPYRNLKDHVLEREGNRFVGEGPLVVERMLRSSLAVESVFISQRLMPDAESAQRWVAQRRPDSTGGPASLPQICLAPNDLFQGVVGYQFHRGILACAFRPPQPDVNQVVQFAASTPRPTVLLCPQIIQPENLGLVFRSAAALGIRAAVLGPRCCHPFVRRTARVSMGAMFSMCLRQSTDFAVDVQQLRSQHGFQVLGTVIDRDALPLSHVRREGPEDRMALMLGPEDHGLDAAARSLCDRLVTIPMQDDIDSLNVAMAATVFFYHVMQAAR
jgi:tRNA G18 (ribose-2'-O)-methylase SpoU